MGQILCQEGIANDRTRLGAALLRPGHHMVGSALNTVFAITPSGTKTLPVFTDNIENVFADADIDVVIDFTQPDATLHHCALAQAHKKPLVIGTTGLSEGQEAQLRRHAMHCPILFAANMSLGVNLLMSLVEKASAALGSDFDVEILEMHHKHKKDSPSGTALALGKAVATGRDLPASAATDHADRSRMGEREPGSIGYAVLRGGTVAGEHSVIFAGADERISLTHLAGDRYIFARGAVQAAIWLVDHFANTGKAGLYDMQHVLGLRAIQ